MYVLSLAVCRVAPRFSHRTARRAPPSVAACLVSRAGTPGPAAAATTRRPRPTPREQYAWPAIGGSRKRMTASVDCMASAGRRRIWAWQLAGWRPGQRLAEAARPAPAPLPRSAAMCRLDSLYSPRRVSVARAARSLRRKPLEPREQPVARRGPRFADPPKTCCSLLPPVRPAPHGGRRPRVSILHSFATHRVAARSPGGNVR